MDSIQRTPGRSRRLLYLLLTWNIVVESIKKKFYEQGLLNSHSKMTYKKSTIFFFWEKKRNACILLFELRNFISYTLPTKPPSLHQYQPCWKPRALRRHSTHPGLPLSQRIVRLVKPSWASTSSIAAVAHRTTWSTLFTDVSKARKKTFWRLSCSSTFLSSLKSHLGKF